MACTATNKGTFDKTVGFVLLPDKAEKHITPRLSELCDAAGFGLNILDADSDLEQQEPYDVIVHKASKNEAWAQKLEQLHARHPDVKLVEPVHLVRPLQNRATMLAPLEPDGIIVQAENAGITNSTSSHVESCVCCIAPRQVPLEEGTSYRSARDQMAAAGMHLPLLAKPMWTDGREGSHTLALIHEWSGLEALTAGRDAGGVRLPVMLQQYVEHGGCLFKVYVMGASVVLARRVSLVLSRRQGVQYLDRISAFREDAAATRSGVTESSSSSSAEVAQPPEWLVVGLAAQLRRRLHLQLFNFDLIMPAPGGLGDPGPGKCLVVDINYFPGYEKLPGYEERMVGFLQAVLADEPAEDGYGPKTYLACSQLPQTKEP